MSTSSSSDACFRFFLSSTFTFFVSLRRHNHTHTHTWKHKNTHNDNKQHTHARTHARTHTHTHTHKHITVWILSGTTQVSQQNTHSCKYTRHFCPLAAWKEGHLACKKIVVGAGMVICLGCVQICIWPSWCHCHSLSLAPVNPDWFLPFWYRLTRKVTEKRPLVKRVKLLLFYLSTLLIK